MLSKHHISLSLFSAFLPIAFFAVSISTNPITILGIVISSMVGVFIGSLLPDTDLDSSRTDTIYNLKPSRDNLQGLNKGEKALARLLFSILGAFAFLIGKFTKYILNPITARVVGILLNRDADRNHRGTTHTVLGVVLNTLILGLVILAAQYAIMTQYVLEGAAAWYPTILVIGIFVGEIFHLLEDSCTISGITPFLKMKIHGGISTGDQDDHRPGYSLGIIVGCDALVGVAIWYFQIVDYMVWFGLSMAALALAWGFIFVLSGVRVKA